MTGVWFARRTVPGASPEIVEIVGWVGDEYADGTTVEDAAPANPARQLAVVRSEAASGKVIGLWVDAEVAPNAPAMWYVAQPEPAARPPAMTLVAFGAADLPEGTVVDAEQFTGMPVRSAEQLAAVRWWTATGQVHQIYVSPLHRRRGIATKLLTAAGFYAVGRGWPRLWGGGERTDLGETLATAGPDFLRRRALPRTRVLPPMTPDPRSSMR